MSKSIVREGRVKALLATPLAASLVLAACFAGSASAENPSRVRAVYNINFNGMNVGEFSVRANLAEHEYTISAEARISVLAGLVFEWNAKTASNGRVVNRMPAPAAYSFGYEAGDKHERIDLRFSENSVRDVAVNPPARGAGVPVTRAHLNNVMDPLSALVLLANHNVKGSNICNRRLPIFDGKQRYDLVLSYKRTKRLASEEGHRGTAYVCKVKFLPIAGHKPGDPDSNYAARNESMEVWMVPVSRTGLYVPYYIHIPTQVGVATLTYVKIDVDKGGSGRRALVD